MMTGGVSVITGGGTGIGAALAKSLVSRSQRVLLVGRRVEPLLHTQRECLNPDLVHTVTADISTSTGRDKVLKALKPEDEVKALVHNAAVLEPVGKLTDIDADQWRKHMEINVEGPLFLTKAILPKFQTSLTDSGGKGGRILHISSGAAHSPRLGWGPYCTSKAAFHMLYRNLALELAPLGIFVGSARPGMVDTPMQDFIREQDEEALPTVATFRAVKENGDLLDAVKVGRFLDWLLNEVDDDEFSEKEWDVRDDEHHHRWKDY